MQPPDRRLRIAHLALVTLPRIVGGMQIVVDSLIRSQSDARCDATLVTRWKQYRAFRAAQFPYPALPLPPNPKRNANPIGPVGPRWPTAAAIRWHQWRYRFDLWHIHSVYPAGWMAHDTLVRAGVPVVMTAHGGDIETDAQSGHGFRLRPEHDRRVRDLLPRVRYLTAISPSVEERYLELGVPQSQIRRIPNGVDFPRFRAHERDRTEVRTRFGLPVDRDLILTVGLYRPPKGHGFIPPALAALLDQGRKVAWVVLGSDPAAMQGLARDAGVAEHLYVIPSILGDAGAQRRFPADAVIDLYNAADVFAMPSLSEGFGLAAVEAMAAGLPVVVTDVPGLRHIVCAERDGLLCAPRDPGGMAHQIGRVLDHPQLARSLSEAAVDTARKYDWRTISSQYLNLYREAIGRTAA